MWLNGRDVKQVLVARSASYFNNAKVLALLRQCQIIVTSQTPFLAVIAKLCPEAVVLRMPSCISWDQLQIALRAMAIVDPDDTLVEGMNYGIACDLVGNRPAHMPEDESTLCVDLESMQDTLARRMETRIWKEEHERPEALEQTPA